MNNNFVKRDSYLPLRFLFEICLIFGLVTSKYDSTRARKRKKSIKYNKSNSLELFI